MIDSHCHLYSEEFREDREAMLERALGAGIQRFYMPAIDSSTHASMLDVETRYPGRVHSMMGLHPCSVKENYAEELNIIQQLLTEKKFAAIGETGLDFYWDKTFVQQQYEAFEKQIRLALQYHLPIVLHTRNAMRECIDVIAKHKQPGLKGIFHCFGGTLQEANEIISLGFLLGIGGVVTYKNGGLDKVLPDVSLEHLVLETDAPYLAPVPYRGKRNEPAYLAHIGQRIADIKNIPVEEVTTATTANAMQVFAGNE